MLKINKSSHLIDSVEYLPSTNCDKRPQGYLIDTIIIHCISLPEGIFDNNNVADLFMNNLDLTKHPTFKSLKDLKVSSHVFIKRNGQIIQFVPFNLRAWHAGKSNLRGRDNCNDFSIGIELEGSTSTNFEGIQYTKLNELIVGLRGNYPEIVGENIIGHNEVSTGRKTDPGPFFDWSKIKN
ncbi:MAG: 1,6-anhydro-N-acetylmuramyl-L-alanine amidase AmpD [Pseudomonadota bacterium]|nr:1,6-anhydro-N-acetylmuramyl-L-alanine amidase AmpD [Pseudomonadota bacterium]